MKWLSWLKRVSLSSRMKRLERPIDAELVVDYRTDGVDSRDQVPRETYCHTGISDHFRSSAERAGAGVAVRW